MEDKYAGFGGPTGAKTPHYMKKPAYLKKIIVDLDGYGDVTNINDALAIATEGTVIKLCEGVHFCKSTIKVGGIKIEPYQRDRPVYLLGDEGPTIKIDVPMDNY